VNAFKKYQRDKVLDPLSLKPETTVIDETHILFEKTCVFTGTLDKMPRKNAMQSVVNHGGYCGKTITKETNFLILGNKDYCKSIKDGKSNKQKKAEALKLQSYDIEIIAESVFYEIIGIIE
jgi:DNA polymerase-3 subunit epsilon